MAYVSCEVPGGRFRNSANFESGDISWPAPTSTSAKAHRSLPPTCSSSTANGRPRTPLLIAAAQVAAGAEAPGPELLRPFKEQRDAVLATSGRGEQDDARTLAAGWMEAVLAQEPGECQALELVAAVEALSLVLDVAGRYSDAAFALAIALRLHDRRRHLPFHGVLLRHAAWVTGNLGGLDAGRLLAAESLRLAIETEDGAGMAYSLCSAANLAAHRKDWSAALRSIAAAWRHVPEGEPQLRFSLLLGETNALLATGRLAEAGQALDRTKAGIAGHESPRTNGFFCWTAGRLRVAEGRHEEAVILLTQALQLARSTQDPPNWMMILLDLGEALEALGRIEELRERCSGLLADLPPLASFESGHAVVSAFRALVKRLGIVTDRVL